MPNLLNAVYKKGSTTLLEMQSAEGAHENVRVCKGDKKSSIYRHCLQSMYKAKLQKLEDGTRNYEVILPLSSAPSYLCSAAWESTVDSD